MDLSSIFSNFGSDPWANYSSVLQGLGGLYGGISSIGNNRAINGQVQGALNSNSAALQQQAAALQQQIDQTRQQAQDQYNAASANVRDQNAQIQGQIDQGSANLAALSDPNSPYMQQARQAIERKDAASGRNSQWGDREVQLAALLADNVSKYSPGINQAITQARNQIAQNNGGLAQLYNTALNPSIQTQQQQLAAIQAQLNNANAFNTTGRQAQNAATNSIPNFLNGLGGTIRGLGGLFGGNSNSAGVPSGFSNWTDYNYGMGNGGTDNLSAYLNLNNNFGTGGGLWDD